MTVLVVVVVVVVVIVSCWYPSLEVSTVISVSIVSILWISQRPEVLVGQISAAVVTLENE